MPLRAVENLSEETINLLKAVIKRNNKKKHFENSRNMWLLIALILLSLFMAILYFKELEYVTDPFLTFANILLNPLYLFIIGIISLSFVSYNYYQKKLKKEKDKLNKVRSEVIDYLNDSKNMNLQDKVADIKKEMNEIYDINLYVKNK